MVPYVVSISIRYQFHTFAACEKAVLTEYPMRNFLSILLAVTYVYPALKKFMKVRFHPHTISYIVAYSIEVVSTREDIIHSLVCM